VSVLIGTVHKPKQPEVPEPEGWVPVQYNPLTGRWLVMGAWTPLSSRSEADNLVGRFKDNPLHVRFIEVGSAPKVPVEAIRRLLNWCSDQDDFGYHLGLSESANSVHRWLSAQEEGDK